jgi:hypothetical protein
VQDLTVKFTGYYQNAPTTNDGTLERTSSTFSGSNKSIIELLGLQLNVIFSSDAKLLLLTPAASPDTLPSLLQLRVVVRDVVAGNTVDTDVTTYFGVSIRQTVEDTKTKADPYDVTGKGFDVVEFRMTVAQATFAVQGFSKTKIDEVTYAQETIGRSRSGSFNVQQHAQCQPGGESVPLVLTGM